MTPFKALLQSSGLSYAEAAGYLDIRLDTVKAWAYGKRNCPPEKLREIQKLCITLDDAADQAMDVIAKQDGCAEIVIGYCSDDAEAQELGLPYKSAHDAMLSRLMTALEHDELKALRFVPRGSDTATAAASDAHES